MKIFKLITAALAMWFIGNVTTANADDVIVRHMTKEGKTERLVVDHTQLPELQKAIRESKPLDRFKANSENKSGSLIKTPMRDPAGSQDTEEPEGFAVRFAVEDEEAPNGWIYEPWKVYVCKGNGEYGREYYYAYYPDEYMIEQGYAWGCYVPEGEYTVILSSAIYSVDENMERIDFVSYLYLVEENVKIDGDTTITFRQSDAKNCITASCLLPNGNEAPKDPFVYDENGEIIGHVENVIGNLSRSIININADYCLNFSNYGGIQDLVYVNDLSANWVYVANMSVVDENGAYSNCVTHSGPITTDLHIQNNPMDYKLTTVKFNSTLPDVNTEVKGFGISSKIAWKGADWSLSTGGMVYNYLGITDELPLYINAHASDLISPMALDLITSPAVATNKYKIMAEDWDGTPILDENGEQLYYYEYATVSGSGIFYNHDAIWMCVDSYGYDVDEYPEETFLLPYDKIFSFEKNNTEFFSEAPVLSVFADSFIQEGYSSFDVWPTFYYPCLSSYSLPYSFTAKYNGTLLAENATMNTFNWGEWSFENYKEPGVFDIELSAAWKENDPKAIVRNTIHIDTRNEDYFVPQVVRWQLRNQDGLIGDIATTDSKIYLMCQEDIDTNFKLSVVVPEVKESNLSYAFVREEPFYDYGVWNTRRVYEVSLKDFPGEVGKKYSLEFNLSDASGNTSTQTIGNAFEWAGTTGINSITNDSNVYVADGILHAPADAEVFTIDGRHADRNALASGLYIVKTGNKTTKVLVP